MKKLFTNINYLNYTNSVLIDDYMYMYMYMYKLSLILQLAVIK